MTIASIITIWILGCLTTLIGFALGMFVYRKEEVSSSVHAVKEVIKKKLDASPVGPIMRPTQQQIMERQNPKLQEGKQAFKELLDKILPKDETTHND